MLASLMECIGDELDQLMVEHHIPFTHAEFTALLQT